MNIRDGRTQHHISIDVDANEEISTEFVNLTKGNLGKYFITYFEGLGDLQVSQDGNQWIATGVSENTLVDVSFSLPKYFRVTTSAIVHLTSL